MEVYVVTVHDVSEGRIEYDEAPVFSNAEKANKYFNDCVKEFENHLGEPEYANWVVEQENGYYCAYEKDNFAHEHLLITLRQVEVL